jgi:hypothetical protein
MEVRIQLIHLSINLGRRKTFLGNINYDETNIYIINRVGL